MDTLRLYPPLAGVSESEAFSDNDPGYAHSALNVWSIDHVNGRKRLTKRPGLTDRSSAALNGSAKVKEVCQVVYNNLLVDYASLGAGNAVQERTFNETPFIAGGYRIVASPRGDLYATQATAGGDGRVIYRFNSDLALISTITVNKLATGGYVEALYVDEFDNVWVGIKGTATGGRRILRYSLGLDNEHHIEWTLRDDMAAPNDCWQIAAIKYRNTRLYVFEQATGTNELRVTVYEDVLDTVAPSDFAVRFQVQATALNQAASGMDVSEAGNIYVAFYIAGGAPDQFVRKYSSNGTAIWTIQATVVNRGGHGLGVAVKDDIVATVGHPHAASNAWLNRYRDDGATVTHIWAVSDANAALAAHTPVAIDAFDTIHAIFPMGGGHVVGINEYQAWAGSVAPATQVAGVNNDTPTPCTGMALPPSNPVYTGSAAEPVVPEYVYLASTGTDYQKHRLVSSTPKSGSVRSTAVLGAAGDDLVTVPVGAPGAPTGGAGALAATSRYVHMASHFSKVWILDGIHNLVFDPVEDEVEEWFSETSGTIPKRCSIVEFWRGRACLTGDPDSRHLLHMSEAGNPRGWDLFPPTATSTMAVTISTMPQIGGVGDIINSICPYSNDLLVLFGDHSISVVRGDPAAGGTIDLITSGIGGAFGRCWCIGPQGEVYFFGAQGGLYALNPYAGEVVPLSRDKLDEQLRDVDLSTHYVRLVYDHKRDGVLVLVLPYEDGGTLVTHWYVSLRQGAFWPFQFGTSSATDVQPTAACVFDADDPDDRTILIGCEDGFVRFLDEDAVTDDGLGVDGYVTLGPFSSDDGVHEVRLRDLWAALGDKGDCAWEVFASHRADLPLETPVASGVFLSGRNARIPVRVRGQVIWLRLRNSDTTGSFAIESLSASMGQGDRVRAGAF